MADTVVASHQWIATDSTTGDEYLVSLFESPNRRSPTGRPVYTIEVAARLDRTRWGRPFAVKEIS